MGKPWLGLYVNAFPDQAMKLKFFALTRPSDLSSWEEGNWHGPLGVTSMAIEWDCQLPEAHGNWVRLKNSNDYYFSLEILKSNLIKNRAKKVANKLNRPTREMRDNSDHLCSSARIIMQDFMMSQSGQGSSRQYPNSLLLPTSSAILWHILSYTNLFLILQPVLWLFKLFCTLSPSILS